MRTLFLFALALAGTASLTDDATAFGRRGHRVEATAYSGEIGVVQGVTIQNSIPGYNPYYYPNGGIYPAGYNPTVYPGSGLIRAPGLIDQKGEVPATPRKVPNPMPGK